ncbi:MAG: 4-(cytidine 5'-diphospho)-2-C-methyl-D-erythritol kinase [Pseudomonadota bacterium]|nr:4-(cytidine 5'-diphospho)-2-C-methyl-D-erythritol kinase [Pseudomonadota bacterium]
MAGNYSVVQPSAILEGGFQAAAPAKINRFLHIVGQRDDGYHLLETGFQFVDWCDWIHCRVTHIPGVQILSDPMALGTENLVYKAASALLDGTQYGVEILIEKNLPSGSGLGGGSSDAATTLVALNQIFELGYTDEQLQALGLTLGADVPVFIFGQSCFASGVGDQFEQMHWPGRQVLIANPGVHVSTQGIFQNPKLTRDTPSCKIRALQLDATHNDCEMLVREIYPAVKRLINRMQAFGKPRMTGTGGCVFVVDPVNSDSACDVLRHLAEVKVSLLSNRSMLYTCGATA